MQSQSSSGLERRVELQISASTATKHHKELKKIKRRAKSLTKAKTKGHTNHKESSACRLAKLDSARLSFADSATSSVMS